MNIVENSLPELRRSTLLFLLLIAAQVFVVLSQDPPFLFHGDEGGFVTKALFIKKTGSFPPPSQKHRAILRGDSWGWSDFKPPGMALYVMPFFVGVGADKSSDLSPSQLKTVRNRLCWVQAGMAVFTVCIVFFFFAAKVRYKKSLAVLLGLQPWVFSLTGSFLTLVVTNFLFAVGLFALGFILVKQSISGISWAVTFPMTSLLSLLILFRPDYFPVVAALVIVVTILILTQAKTRFLAFSVSGVFLLAVAGNVGYRLFMDDEVRIYGKVVYPYIGLASWNETWANDVHLRYAIQGIAKNQAFEFDRLPNRVFSDDFERDLIKSLFDEVATHGYSKQVDKRFAEIATEKKNKNWVRYFLWPKSWQFVQSIFHTETNHALLSILTDWPARPRRGLLGVLHAVKVLTVLLWLVAFPVFLCRRRAKVIGSLDWFGLMLASVATIKYLAVYVGISITHAGPEGRLLLGGLPAIQGAAAYTLYGVGLWSK